MSNKIFGHSHGKAYIVYAEVGRACVPFAAFHLRSQVEAALAEKPWASYTEATVHTSYMGERTANILTVTNVAVDADDFVCTLVGNWDLSRVACTGSKSVPVGRMPTRQEAHELLSDVYDGQTNSNFFEFAKEWLEEKF